MKTINHQNLIRRFTEACQNNDQVIAAFLGGSYANRTFDQYSDLDLYLITTDAGYESFLLNRKAFMTRLGTPVFLEDFREFGFDMIVFIFEDGVEGELGLGKESGYSHIHGGEYRILVDKQNILKDVVFPLSRPNSESQQENLDYLLHWFWRDLSLLSVALGRGMLWSGYGNLESARQKLINLMRLANDMEKWTAGYERVEIAVKEDELNKLILAYGQLDQNTIIESVQVVVKIYQEIAPNLAVKAELSYPEELERVVMKKFEEQHYKNSSK